MKILAADTTTSINTVAVCDGERILAETVAEVGRLHSERLIGTVDWVLREAGVALDALDALAISVGPGSFTGVRIGTAAWKGLALAQRLPLVAVGTLDALTRVASFRDGLVCPLLDARMNEVYGALYRFENGRREKLTPDRVGPVERMFDGVAESVMVFGEGAVRYRDRIAASFPQAIFLGDLYAPPRASAVAAEAAALLAQGVDSDPARVVPVYLRQSQPEEKEKRGQPKAPVP